MCGISGIVNFNGTKPVDRTLIERMTSAQKHRGPDDYGYFIDGSVALGHRRLSIIDLSGGSQPMFNEDGSVVVVFNGEIYNYAGLTPELVAHGHTFKTKSDTETIVHAYEEYGDECIRKFRGMFAFAVFDRKRKRLLLARDRLGIKPLYYYIGKDFFVFASEIKALLQHPEVPREVDHQAVDLYLPLRYVPGPRTMFKNIFKLQPGHWIVVDEGGTRIQKYWDLEFQDNGQPDEKALLEGFEQLLEESVRLRLISDVPLGLFLSGGLDSSAMLSLMSRITGGERIKTYSVGYQAGTTAAPEDDTQNECSYARLAAAHLGAEHHELLISAADFQSAIPAMVWHLDEPMADPTCIPLYFMSKLAREHITVVLSGEGADETMAGYTIYRKLLALERMRDRLGPLASSISALAALPIGDRARAYARRIRTGIENHYRGMVKGLSWETRLALAGMDRLNKAEGRLAEVFGDYFRRVQKASPLNRMLYVDTKVWLADDLLLKADKVTMATSIELRVPFLDHKLVEFIATLPDSLKIRQNKGKWILRQTMGTALPPAILRRPKTGFYTPTARWLRSDLRDFVRDTLFARGAACREFFNPQAVEDIVTRNERGKFSGHQDVWSLLIFECWHKQFIKEFAPDQVFDARALDVRARSNHGASLASEITSVA